MRLLAEVKVRHQCVLKQMDTAVPGQQQDRSPARVQRQTFRNHLEHGRRQHEARPKSDKIPQRSIGRQAPDEDESAGHIRQTRHKPEQGADPERPHRYRLRRGCGRCFSQSFASSREPAPSCNTLIFVVMFSRFYRCRWLSSLA